MATDRTEPDAVEETEHGVLGDAAQIDTAGIGIVGGFTAHLDVSLPRVADDDDLVDDDVVVSEVGSADLVIDLDADPRTAPVTAALLREPIVDEIAAEPAVDDVVVGGPTAVEAATESTAAESVETESAAAEPVEVEPVAAEPIAKDATEPAARTPKAAEPVVKKAKATEPVMKKSKATDRVGKKSKPAEPVSNAPKNAKATEPVSSTPKKAEAPAKTSVATDPVAGTREAEEPSRDANGQIRNVAVAAAQHKEAVVAEQSEKPGTREVERVHTRHELTLASKRLGELSQSDRETPDLLTADRLLDPHQLSRPEPEGAWRQFVYSISGKRINLGDGKRARARKLLDRRIAAPLSGGARFVAVVSRKGGVGKTTVTALLGQALADAREDRIIAIDANPDRGTLAERIARPSGKTVRDLVRAKDTVSGYNDISTIVARDETRLDVLASDSDPRVSEAFSDHDYRDVATLAAHYYSIVLTDTGTGIVHSVMEATLDLSEQLVIVAGLSVDEARLASETLTWLETNGYEDAVSNAVVVLNNSRPGTPLVRPDELETHFRTRVRDVVRIPYDASIATGSAIAFRDLQPATRTAARELAAKVVEGLRSYAPAA